LSTSRSELGMIRGPDCQCLNCSKTCRSDPGFLIPSDIERMWKLVAPNLTLLQFAKAFLEAGKAGTVMDENAMFIKTQTLRPKKMAGGACIFFHAGRCAIHDQSPYGCWAFDCKMSAMIIDERTKEGFAAIFEDLKREGIYFNVLHNMLGLRRSQIVEDITQRLFPKGVPKVFKDIADLLKQKKHDILRGVK
jgi:Fe-S-cluster containining protein